MTRVLALISSVALAAFAVWLGLAVALSNGTSFVDVILVAVLGLTTWWIAWGAIMGMIGALSRDPLVPETGDGPLQTRTAILMPVYNEDPKTTLSHVAAMIDSLRDTGHEGAFEVAVLSDTTKDEIAEQERFWFEKLKGSRGHVVPCFYRRRDKNTGRKAGNIEDFVRRFGGRYDFMVILDADSLMSGTTLVEMVRRMEADPKLGLLQTLPRIVAARSFFGRVLQFSASFYSPDFTRGLITMQGKEGPFWGHNAITRTRAFAESCGLPELPGKAPFGGHIMSHDYVEAALLARAGWTVRVDADLQGSYEECPANILDYAKRDRRWAQGNLQHIKLLNMQGLKVWNRFTFLQGIMSYLASPFWAIFLIATIMTPVVTPPYDYFPGPDGVPVFPISERTRAMLLLAIVLTLLLGPKLVIVLRAAISGRARRFGGIIPSTLSVIVEVIWSSIIAPIMLAYQTRSVIQILIGADSGWPSADRDGTGVSLRESFAASWWVSLAGAILLGAAWYLTDLLVWFMPVGVPLLLAPFLITLSSFTSLGNAARAAQLFFIPEEVKPERVMTDRTRILETWQNGGGSTSDPAHAASGPPLAS